MNALTTILDKDQLHLTLKRLAHQLIENHYPFTDTCFIGIQPRGIPVSDYIIQYLSSLYPGLELPYGKLDITFYRDDIRRQLHLPSETHLPFSIENRKVVLIDDVLYTGRTIRAALDALLDNGRPSKVELCVLVDRRYSRQLPIQPDYFGKAIDSFITQKVKVWLGEDPKVVLYDNPESVAF
jgi:pyrimidine operon attenuation protein / uracil phosphoribosyltransferase